MLWGPDLEALSVKCRQGGGEEEGEGGGQARFLSFHCFPVFLLSFCAHQESVSSTTKPFYRWFSLQNLIVLPVCLIFEESNYIVIKIVKIQWALAKCQIFLAVIDRTQCKAHKRTDITGWVDFGSLNAMEQLNGTLGTSKKWEEWISRGAKEGEKQVSDHVTVTYAWHRSLAAAAEMLVALAATTLETTRPR